jgi:NitT/TauT family transport system substrate-binding protein
MTEATNKRASDVSRRRLLQYAGATGAAASLAFAGRGLLDSADAEEPTKLKVAWAQGAACHSPLAFAQSKGIFAKHGLDVELIKFSGSTQQLLESIATGKADAGIGLLLSWLKPLEQGFDVKLIAGTHSGCMRLLAAPDAGIAKVEDLKGKIVAVSDLASPARDAFVVTLAKAGIDPDKEVEWKVFPADLLGTAVEKGEAQAVAHLDPETYRFKKQNHLIEIANTQSGVYADRTCCVVGAGGPLLKNDLPAVRKLVEAVLEVHEYTAAHPREIAQNYYDEFKPSVSVDDLTEMLSALPYHHHPAGAPLTAEIKLAVDDLKLVKVFKPSLDSAAFASDITFNVLA